MKNKKASFNALSIGLIGFIGFILMTLMTILLLSSVKQTGMVCGSGADGGTTNVVRYSNGQCQTCPPTYVFNTSGNFCCNLTTSFCSGTNATPTLEYSGSAWNATKLLTDAALIPPQFSSLVMIVIIISGILVLLASIGYGVYRKIKG